MGLTGSRARAADAGPDAGALSRSISWHTILSPNARRDAVWRLPWGGPASTKAGLAGGFRRPQATRLAGLGFPSSCWVYYYAERTNTTTSQSSKASCTGAFSNSEDPRVARVPRCTHRALANGRGVVSEGTGRRCGVEPRRRPAQRGSAPPLAEGPSGCGC